MEESRMTRNPYGIKIEVNMSNGTRYLENILSFAPDKQNLLGCHNFYPQEYTGLGEDFFVKCSKLFRENNINTAAFVSSNAAKFGPWPVQDGLPTIEDDRHLPIDTQVQHLLLTGLIDDVLIGNAYASEDELKAASVAFFGQYPVLHADFVDDLTENESWSLWANPICIVAMLLTICCETPCHVFGIKTKKFQLIMNRMTLNVVTLLW